MRMSDISRDFPPSQTPFLGVVLNENQMEEQGRVRVEMVHERATSVGTRLNLSFFFSFLL